MREPSPLCPDATSGLSLGDRVRQEDALALSMPEGCELGFAILSDGMGGHSAGDLASRLIVSEVFAELTVRCREGEEDLLDVPAVLRHAIAIANDSLRAHVASRPTQRGMGGTVVVAVVWRGHLYWASVGDSLLLLVRDGQVRRLNADHSMAPQLDLMVAKGLMDREVARMHPQRSCLTSAVSGESIAEVDCPETALELLVGDLVLLASDGLLSLAPDVLDAAIAKARDDGSRGITRALLRAVADAGIPEQDNTSVVAIDMRDGAQATAEPMLAKAHAARAWRGWGRAFGLHRAAAGPR